MSLSYRPAQLYQGLSEWYIYYFFWNPATNKYQRFKERFDINRIRDKFQRLEYGLRCVKFVNSKLAEGHNPFTAIKAGSLSSGRAYDQLSALIEIIVVERCTSTPTKYFQTNERFNRFLKAEALQDISMLNINEDTARAFQNWMKATKLSPKTINSTISYMGLFWDEAKIKKMVSGNPWRDLRSVKNTGRRDIFMPLTSEELKQVFDYLNTNNERGFARFLAMIYYAFARPIEVTKLRVGDINLEECMITFRSSDTKSGKGACVQIVPQLKTILEELGLQNYPRDYYVFGGQTFTPNIGKKSSIRIGLRWVDIVHGKLKIPKLMYALKHTGNIHYLLNNKGNVDLKWQQMQNRHSSATMTEKYNRALGAYFIDLDGVNFTDI